MLVALFLSLFLLAEPTKIDNLMKNVGKRFFPVEPEVKKIEGGRRYPVKFSEFDQMYLKWKELSDENVMKIKMDTAKRVVDTFIELSSTENGLFQDSLLWAQSIMTPDMTAEICGDGKKMNAYQYFKFLTHFGSQHKGIPDLPKDVEIVGDARDELRLRMELSHTDKFGLLAKIEYDITMKLTLVNSKKGSLFSISRVIQGGSCSEHGIVGYSKTDPIDMTIDNIEKLKTHPNALSLLNFFTPPIYQLIDQNPTQIPRFWLSGLVKDVSKISICHEGITEPKEYTKAEFESWFNGFRLMWHLKEGEKNGIDLQVLDVKDDSITARITMKLQIGSEDTVHDWNFKISAKKNTKNNGYVIQTPWHIEQLEVMCTPTVELKHQSIKAIGDTVAKRFVEELEELGDPSQWHSIISFVNLFTKNELEFEYCGGQKLKNPALDIFKVESSIKNFYKITKYSSDIKDMPTPDSVIISLKTISIDDDKKEYENEWTFDTKWDEMDQFYHVEKLQIGCQLEKTDGKYDGFKDINYASN